MTSETEEALPPGAILHDTLNQVSSIISIAQLCLINNKEVSPDIRQDLKRIVEMSKEIAANLKRLAETLEDEEEA